MNGLCIISDKYCEVFDSSVNSNKGCNKCMNGYHTESGICKYNDPNCATYSANAYTQRCIKCVNGLVFSNDGTRCIKASPGCIYDDKNVCISCRAPFRYNANTKTCVINGCNKYTDNGCY